MNKFKEIVSSFLPIIYILVFLGYAYAKVNFIKDYMLLFKTLMYISLVGWYFLTTPRINIIYLSIVFFLATADLAGISGGEVFRWVLSLFYIGNLLITYYIINRLRENKVKKTFFKTITIVLLLVTCSFVISVFFTSYKVVILNFTFPLIILLYVSYLFYAKAVTRSSFLMVIGVVSLVVCYAFSAINQFLQPYKYFSLLDGVTYALALYLITKAIVDDDKEFVENLEIIE